MSISIQLSTQLSARCAALVNGDVLNYFREGVAMAGKQRAAAETVEPYDALNCTHTSLRRAARQLTQIYDDALAPAGLTSAQALLVAQIEELSAREPGGPSLQTLSRRLAIQISALTHALRPLVRDGLVVLETDAADRRVKRAALTETGLRRTHRMYALWNETNRRIEETLGPGAAEQLRLLANTVGSAEFAAALRPQALATE
jgi:DNA-binding MarR family transcriptional regulator